MKQSVGEFLATLRRANGYTQQEVADKLGISNRTLSAWERDTSAPDILLLPALADLYGVTVDEILRGERKAAEEKPISKPSKARLYKSRIATFTLQSWVLTGVVVLGLILFFAGWFTDIRTLAWVGWQWWLLLFWLGLGTVVLGLLSLVARWRLAEMQADEEEECYGACCTLLRGRLAGSLYIFAALSLIFGLVSCFFTWEATAFAPLNVCFLLLAVGFYLFGVSLHKFAITKWGGEDGAAYLKKDHERIKKIALYGFIPLTLALVAVWFTNVFTFPIAEHVVVSGATREEFTRNMETIALSYGSYVYEWEELVVEKGEYYLALSETAESATPNEPIELFRGITVTFNEDKSECGIDVVYTIDSQTDEPNATAWYHVCRADVEEGYHVYDLAYHDTFYDYANSHLPPLSRFAGLSTDYRATKNGYEKVCTVRVEYVPLGGAIAAALLGGDILVCFLIYYSKLEKFRVKL